MRAGLADELARMFEADAEVRKAAWKVVQAEGFEAAERDPSHARMREVQAENARRLAAIVDEHGWPRRSDVGEEGAKAAFLMLQHADLAMQERALPLLRGAVEADEARPQDVALLEDRIRMRRGEQQRYGSQLHAGPDGKPALWPIEDRAHVDERRAAAGLPPLAAYLERVGLSSLLDDAD